MDRAKSSKVKSERVQVGPRDILFECPSCNKSLVVDESAEGVIVECPQCHIDVIVPPKAAVPPGPPESVAAPSSVSRPSPAVALPSTPIPVARLEPTPPAPKPAAEKSPPSALSARQERLAALAGQFREVQTQWTEVSNRITARINDVNRDMVLLTRLDSTHRQLLSEWTKLVGEIAEISRAEAPAVPTPPPAGESAPAPSRQS